MPNSWKESSLSLWWVALACIALDQLTKHWVAGVFELHESLAVMPMFNLTYVHNTGAAFSFLSQAGGWQRWFFTGIAVVVSAVLLRWMRQTPKQNRWLGWGLALVLGGALGNVIDRLTLGYVIDFLDFYIGAKHWPAFNIADSAICVGAVMLVIDGLFSSRAKAVDARD